MLPFVAALSPIVTSIIVCICVPYIDEATKSIDGRNLVIIYQIAIFFHVIVIVTLLISNRRRGKDKIFLATMIGWFIALNIYLTIFPALFYTH